MIPLRTPLGIGIVFAALVAFVIGGTAEAGLRNRFEIGSILIEITQGNPAALVGLAASANQGLEKTITYPLPRLAVTETSVTVPLFLLNADVDDNSNHVVARGIDTLLFLTNANPGGGATLTVHITFRNGEGAALNNPLVRTIAPGQTAVVSAITTLNP